MGRWRAPADPKTCTPRSPASAIPRSSPDITAPPRRWPWLLLAAVVGVVAIFVVTALHAREQSAERAEVQASLFAAQLRESVREISIFGHAVPKGRAASMLRPVIASTARSAGERLNRLDAAFEGEEQQIDALRLQLLDVRRLAAGDQDPAVYGRRL